MTADAARGPTPVVRLDGYEGPLDLLLGLARAQQLDLARLSIVALVDQYVAAVEAPGAAASLMARGDWLVAASWLVLLKSKLLVHDEGGAALPEAEQLREGLLRAEQRQQARALAGWLERQPQLGQEVFARGVPEAPSAASSGEGGDLLDLLLACFDLLDVPIKGQSVTGLPYAPAILDVRPLAEALGHLRTWLHNHPGGGELADLLSRTEGSSPISPLRRRSNLASGFLAGLELAKQGEVIVQQDKSFGPLQLRLAAFEPLATTVAAGRLSTDKGDKPVHSSDHPTSLAMASEEVS